MFSLWEKSERSIHMSSYFDRVHCIPNISQNLDTAASGAISAAHANLGKSTDDRGERHSARLDPWQLMVVGM